MLFYHSRKKALIKYNTHHVYPTNIEEALLSHPDVLEAAAYGVYDPLTQERVMAAVVLKPGANVTEAALTDYANSRLTDMEHIRGGVKFVKEFPTNPQGKVIRSKLLDL